MGWFMTLRSALPRSAPHRCLSVSTLRMMHCLPLCLLILLVVQGGSPSNVLGLFPTTAKSSFLASEAIMKALAARGHNVTVVSCFPQAAPVPNYTDISIRHLREILVSSIDIRQHSLPYTFLDLGPLFVNLISSMDKLLSSPELTTLLSSNSSFDVVFHEMFVDDVFLLVARRFKAPIIAVGPSYILPWAADRFAIPQNPSYIPVIAIPYSTGMSFLQRVDNAITNVRVQMLYRNTLVPKSLETYRKFFGSPGVSVEEAGRGVSMYFVNTHMTMLGARPYPPQVVEIGGIHVQPPQPLPTELKKWMDESADGVIYFCFGSMFRGASLPADKVQVFLDVFRRMRQRVLWKWEDKPLEGFPSNVKVMKWLPQRDVLAHPNVKVFISHGGLLGTTEAVVSGVPILGIPTNMDQANNVAALEQAGVAVGLNYNNLTEQSVYYALNKILTDNSYPQNSKELSRRFQDRPLSPQDTAVYWTEYVIRHKGAPHLQSAAVHLPWYQYYLLDVIVVLTAVLIVLLAIVYYVVKSCLRTVFSKNSNKLKGE